MIFLALYLATLAVTAFDVEVIAGSGHWWAIGVIGTALYILTLYLLSIGKGEPNA